MGWLDGTCKVGKVSEMKQSCLASVVAVMVLSAPALAVKKPRRLKPTKLEIGVYLASEFDAAATYHLLQHAPRRRALRR